MKRIGLIGFGAIGLSIAQDWNSRPPRSLSLIGACVRPQQVALAGRSLPSQTYICTDFEELLALRPDAVIEAAGHGAIRDYGAEVVRQGLSLYVLSVGSLADLDLRNRLLEAAAEGGGHVLIPAGALAGFDGLRTLTRDDIRSVKYTSTKPCHAWLGTPAAQSHALDRLTEPTVIFRGTAAEAARQYPKNANLAAAVALAGVGFEKTQVELIADPGATVNIGTVEAISSSSRLTLSLSSVASSNPKTSAIVGASVLASLENSTAPIQFV
jgi:aspartate dehydrogenase